MLTDIPHAIKIRRKYSTIFLIFFLHKEYFIACRVENALFEQFESLLTFIYQVGSRCGNRCMEKYFGELISGKCWGVRVRFKEESKSVFLLYRNIYPYYRGNLWKKKLRFLRTIFSHIASSRSIT